MHRLPANFYEVSGTRVSYQQFIEIQSVLNIVLRRAWKAAGYFLRKEVKYERGRNLSWSGEKHDVDPIILCLYTVLLKAAKDQETCEATPESA
ncbi:hypothetical protein R1N_20730 [Enterobacter asburiae]|jgi:hypothetical protein|nr:hypothetical protein R1N_20730 [Enterobacter asburiae]